MSVYFVAQIKITDESEYGKYLNGCDEVFAKFNGRYLAVDTDPIVIEGTQDSARSVIIEFPSREDFDAWYYSEEYQRLLKHRLAGSVSNSIVVQGK